MSKARHRPLAAAALSLALLPAPALAMEPSPSPPPTSAELQRQGDEQAGTLAEREAAQLRASATAATALEAYQAAQRQAEQAAREAKEQANALARAERATAAAQEQLSQYLGTMYRSGVGDRRLSALTSLGSARSPEALFGRLGLANRIGEQQNDAVDALARAQASEALATQRASATGVAAQAAAERAAVAKKASDAAVVKAALRVEQARTALAATTAAFLGARAREGLVARAESIARQRAGIPAAAVEGAFVRRMGTCEGAPTTGYPNGRIPLAALCALWGTSGHVVRADAAAAFYAMSRSYAEVFGTPICVTDSYRDYDGQVAVRAAKPTLAAVPGTSNHGWGVALDLCDGIQSFGTPQHRWMQDSAMAFGFFHPSWAQAGGSKPEPWHWEFAG